MSKRFSLIQDQTEKGLMKTITKKQIVHEIARRKGMDPKEVQRIIQEFLDSLMENLSEGDRFDF